MQKRTYDFRGRQGSIFRLARFEPFGLVHALFYRILLAVSLAYGLLICSSLVNPQLGPLVKLFTILVWILITPQLFEAFKGIILAVTHGRVFNKFSEAYSYLIWEKRRRVDFVFKAIPYIVLFVWIAFFFAMLVWWPT